MLDVEFKSRERLVEDPNLLYNQWITQAYTALGYSDIRSKFVHRWNVVGSTIVAKYHEGKMTAAVLVSRNANLNNRCITEKVEFVLGLPSQLKKAWTFNLYGVITLDKEDFKGINLARKDVGVEPFSSPSGYVENLLLIGTPDQKYGFKKLRFLATGVHFDEGGDDRYYKTEDEKVLWLQECKIHSLLPQIHYGILGHLKGLPHIIQTLKYVVDGIDITPSFISDQRRLEKLGIDSSFLLKIKSPPSPQPTDSYTVEKSRDVGYFVSVDKIVWKVDMFGKILADMILKQPVYVRNKQLFTFADVSATQIVKNQIDVGTQLMLNVSGDHISIGTVLRGRGTPQFPSSCPCCRHSMRYDWASAVEVVMRCTNKLCAAQIVKSVFDFIFALGVQSLTMPTITELINSGAVSTFADVFDLDVPRLVNAQPRQTASYNAMLELRTLARIHRVEFDNATKDEDLIKLIGIASGRKKSVPLWQLLSSFSIPGIDKKLSLKIASHFNEFDILRKASVSALSVLPCLSVQAAKSINYFFADNEKLVDDLLFHIEPEISARAPFYGQIFVLTGNVATGKDKWRKKIEDKGGFVTDKISTVMVPRYGEKIKGWVVAGPGSAKWTSIAVEAGIPVISAGDLALMLEQATKK